MRREDRTQGGVVGIAAFFATTLILCLCLCGCGGNSGSTDNRELAALIEKRLFQLGQPIELAGGRFVFTDWGWFSEITQGEEKYLPLKGRYIAVRFTFQGSPSASPEQVSPELFKLMDMQGRLFFMDESICSGPARALAEAEGRELPGSLKWDEEAESASLLLFDVPFSTEILTLVVDAPPGWGSPGDRVELVLEE